MSGFTEDVWLHTEEGLSWQLGELISGEIKYLLLSSGSEIKCAEEFLSERSIEYFSEYVDSQTILIRLIE